MILSFYTHINHYPTFFVERILGHLGLDAIEKYAKKASGEGNDYTQLLAAHVKRIEAFRPKKTTIRKDTHKRWKVGRKIHFSTGARTSKYSQFAEGICKKVLPIALYPNAERVVLDGKELTQVQIYELARDDGFETTHAFWNWFKKDFTGVILYF